MAHINFLDPPKFSLRQFNLKNFEMNYFWMMVVAGSLLVLMITYGVVQRARIGGLTVTVEMAAAEARKRAGTPSPGTGVAAKVSLMDGLRQRIVWSPILNAIANNTPDTISLNYIKGATTGATARTVQIEGAGADVLASARYETELAKIPYFSRVFLFSSVERTPGAPRGEVPKAEGKEETRPSAPAGVLAAAGPGGKKQLTFEIQGWLK